VITLPAQVWPEQARTIAELDTAPTDRTMPHRPQSKFSMLDLLSGLADAEGIELDPEPAVQPFDCD